MNRNGYRNLRLPERVDVVDGKNKFISVTHPARVRKLLKTGKARVFSRDPFTIQLVDGGGTKKMKPTKTIINFTDYFRGDERDVYVQNVSNTQISLQFETSPGRTDPVLIPKGRRPINLTQHVAYDAIKRSTDLRKLVNRRPAALILMTQDEAMSYYEALGQTMNTSAEEEYEKALEIQSNLMRREAQVPPEQAPKTIDQLKDQYKAEEEEGGMVEEQPLPRIIGLCASVDAMIPDAEKTDPAEMLAELESMEDELRQIDIEYVASRGYYPIIRKWANTRMDQFLGIADGELPPTPPAPPTVPTTK
jgi:hypothetical protein